MSGCPDTEGCFNILTTRRDDAGVYQPYTGSSFVMAAELTDDGPRGSAILRYSQSENPRSRALRRPDAAVRAGALAAAALHRARDQERPGLRARAGDGPQMSRERPVAVGLVLAAAGSLQVGAAFAITLFDELGPGGAAFLRLAFAAVVLWAIWRPRIPSHPATCACAVAFGVALGLMNWSIYESIARIPLGVAVTIEFAGPLLVAVLGSRRPLDGVWVALAAAGIVLLADPGGGSIDGARRVLRAAAPRPAGWPTSTSPSAPARRSRAAPGWRSRWRSARWSCSRRASCRARARCVEPRPARRRAGRRARLLRAALLARARGAAAAAGGGLRRADVARAGGRRARRLRRARAGPRRARAGRDRAWWSWRARARRCAQAPPSSQSRMETWRAECSPDASSWRSSLSSP